MEIEEFRNAIRREFGPNLEHATPANVREFLDRLGEHSVRRIRGRIELNESKSTYEEILKDFFDKVLDFPKDEAIILLWVLAFEWAFSNLELQLAERLDPLFRECE
ncbi:MAG: hypothetical protein M1330_05240 [Armatimonadetes bacterium]|nr:hypothetical protein [Armatimonadota bacterium]